MRWSNGEQKISCVAAGDGGVWALTRDGSVSTILMIRMVTKMTRMVMMMTKMTRDGSVTILTKLSSQPLMLFVKRGTAIMFDGHQCWSSS